ncbi:MAG: hypothetical protein GVY19_03820 [Bacteroidetes bacterium]|jgi:putative ABC transport system permease protein|nr:hypothetical protein [Bacteroidota bacterium]
MLKYYFKSAIKSLSRNSQFTLINIIGFSFGISVCLAIITYLIHEYSYDQYHKHAESIYKLTKKAENSSEIDYRVKDILLENYPEIENACITNLLAFPVSVSAEQKGHYIDNILSCDNAFFEMFTIPVVRSVSAKLLPDRHSVVITKSAAKTLFGNVDPLGKELVLRHQHPLMVTGIIEDFPDNSSIQANLIVNGDNDDFKFSFSCENYQDESSHRWPFEIYLLLEQHVNPEMLISKMNAHPEITQPYGKEFGFLALKDIYLNDPTHDSRTMKGSKGLLGILTIIGGIILCLALINFINLTVSQINKRGNEIGIKKTIGAYHRNISRQIVSETLVVMFISFLMAMTLLYLLVPFYQSIFYTHFQPNILFRNHFWLFLIPAILILSWFTGSVISMLFYRVGPLKAISNNLFSFKQHNNITRNTLTIFQFTVSIVLIFVIIVISKQIHYVKHKELGFNDSQLLRLDLPTMKQENKGNSRVMMDKFHQYPGITSMTATNGVPGDINSSMGANIEGKDGSLSILMVDTAFVHTFQLSVLHGRTPLPGEYGEVCLFNEAAFRYFEWNNLENKIFNNGREGGYRVVGVVENFHYQSMHNKIEPMAILYGSWGYEDHLNIRLASSSIAQTMDFIKEAWAEILPGYPIKYQFYDVWFDAMYEKEEKFAQSISLFAILAIIISCIGILGLSVITSANRIKEIGIRKVNGAKVREIIGMLNTDFVKWVMIANILAVPIGYFVATKWLANFAYQTGLSLWIFIMAGLIALVVAILTVSWQSWRAASRNPVEALRYE